MGPTAVEICSHPLLPGRQYKVHLSQSGHIAVESLSLWLACEEEVTYHQGTDIRHEVRAVLEEKIDERTSFQIEPGMPFQIECLVRIPSGAMHSFQSEHNAIHWWLVVRGSLTYWPRFERRFPIIIYPGESTMRIPEPTVTADPPSARTSTVPRPLGPRRSQPAGVSA
jgi:hypothetical protein